MSCCACVITPCSWKVFRGGHLPVVESPALFLRGQILPRRLVRCVHRATVLPLPLLYHAAASGSSTGSKSLDIRRKGALSCRFRLLSVPRVNAEKHLHNLKHTEKTPSAAGLLLRLPRASFILHNVSALSLHCNPTAQAICAVHTSEWLGYYITLFEFHL